MADIFDLEPSTLLCDESKDLCFDDLGGDGLTIDDEADHHGVSTCRSEPSIYLPPQGEEVFASMVERETEYLPKDDYLSRLQCGELDLSARKEAFDWIWKAHSYYSFGPLSFCLAVNYLDRFLSIRELPRENAWAVQLLAVACLSIAAKVEETSVPQSIDLQVGDPKFVFEARTIQRMELLVLDTLNWKMNAITPCSFLDYILKKLSDDKTLSLTTNVVNRSMQLILSSIRGIDLLVFKPSEIAVAVAISVSAEYHALDIDNAISHFTHLEKERVLKCLERVKGMAVISSRSGNVVSMAESPIGVLDAACFSYKSDESTTTMTTTIVGVRVGGSSANSCGSPEAKRQKLETSSSSSTTTTRTTNSGLES